MSYIQPISGNQFYGAIENTLVNNRAIYQASQGKGKLSVLRQVSGIVTIPVGYTASTAATGYLPIIEDDGVTQVIVPFRSIVDSVEYSAIPFGSVESALDTVTVQGFSSTTPYTTTVYTAGAILSLAAVTVAQVNTNIVNGGVVTGRATASGIYGVLAIVNGGQANITATQVSKIRVTVYYYSGQDLNN